MKNINNGEIIDFTGLSFTKNLTGLFSPIIVHIKPATNINDDILDNIKNIFFFIISFLKLNTLFHTPKLNLIYYPFIIFCISISNFTIT